MVVYGVEFLGVFVIAAIADYRNDFFERNQRKNLRKDCLSEIFCNFTHGNMFLFSD